jgi:hypothetical protein
VTALKTLTFLVAAVVMLIIESVRRSPSKEEDDAVGLFVGSARPLAAKTRVPGQRR